MSSHDRDLKGKFTEFNYHKATAMFGFSEFSSLAFMSYQHAPRMPKAPPSIRLIF